MPGIVIVTALKSYFVGGPDLQLLLCSRGQRQNGIKVQSGHDNQEYIQQIYRSTATQLRVREYPSQPVESAVEFKLAGAVVHWG